MGQLWWAEVGAGLSAFWLRDIRPGRQDKQAGWAQVEGVGKGQADLPAVASNGDFIIQHSLPGWIPAYTQGWDSWIYQQGDMTRGSQPAGPPGLGSSGTCLGLSGFQQIIPALWSSLD